MKKSNFDLSLLLISKKLNFQLSFRFVMIIEWMTAISSS